MPTAINMALNSTHVSPSALKGDGRRREERKNIVQNPQYKEKIPSKYQLNSHSDFQLLNIKKHRDDIES